MPNSSRKRKFLLGLAAVPVLLLLCSLLYRWPPVYSRMAWRVDQWRARIKYAVRPPEQAIFVPQAAQTEVNQIVQATLQALTPTPLPPSLTPFPIATLPGPTATPAPSATPTIPPTPLPPSIALKGVRHEYQKWNNCGPATLSMALSFWGWTKNQDTTAAYLKPNERDKNVSPYEMKNFVDGQTDLQMLWRTGGDLNLLKTVLANGFPVIVEKGFHGAGFDGWMGHYELLTAYDDGLARFTAQDSYRGPNYAVPYDTILDDWRAFNYTFLIPYPLERQSELLAVLGNWADADWANRHALQVAEAESQTLSGQDLFFAWYNIASSHVRLYEYIDAANAFDFAFSIYANLPEEERPWRILWYQTAPYFAYYYAGRYQDVINLANNTLNAMSEPVLEESFYWRALAREALGDSAGALADMQEAVRLNSNFTPGWVQLNRLQNQ